MVKRMINDSRARFFESLEQDIKANTKRFWSVFKLGNKASSVPEQISVPSSSKNTATCVTSVRNVVFSSVDIAEAFNQHLHRYFLATQKNLVPNYLLLAVQSFKIYPSHPARLPLHFVPLTSAKQLDLMRSRQGY